MKKTQPIDWDKVEFIDFFNTSIRVTFGEGESPEYLDNDFIAAFDEMLEEEIKKNAQAIRLCYSWDNKTGWYFDSKKLRKPLKSIFKTTHETCH